MLLPGALRRFCTSHPAVDIFVKERGGRDLVRLLAQGELDLALISLPLHTRDPALATTAFLREPLVVAAPVDDPLVRARSLRVRDLARYPLVMLREGYDMRAVTLAACRRERIEPKIAIEGGELDSVLACVEAGLGVAVVPSMVLEGRPRLRRIPFAPPGLSRTLAFAHRRDVEASAAARAFRATLLDHLADRARVRALPRGVELTGPAKRPARAS